uniref:MtN25 protein n=1 Tax=Medicago truncatula TaxID=3880 RepID=O24089_MEDTR|nr:MtN25 [Medicago truncatula]
MKPVWEEGLNTVREEDKTMDVEEEEEETKKFGKEEYIKEKKMKNLVWDKEKEEQKNKIYGGLMEHQ